MERLTEAIKAEEAGDDEDNGEKSIPDQPMEVTEEKPLNNDLPDDSNQSMEDGEPDLANMIVLDEVCDPAKQQPVALAEEEKEIKVNKEPNETKEEKKAIDSCSKKQEKSPVKEKEVKKLSEKDIRQLQRRYTLPDTPEIVVHPSRTAKGGKFDCSIMSLSVLLDYGLTDTKEHSFELFLFAELFNEMLMRDAGFNVYKALQAQPEKRSEEATTVEVSEEKGDKKKEEDKKEESSGDHRKRAERERKKQITYNPELLLSFAYFDQTQCGYILCKDLEDLFGSIGLELSKNQIRRVVKRGTEADSLYYR